MKENWNKRFASEEYVYGKEPNEWVKLQLSKIKPSKILFPGEGEGRNAVWAAKNGFDVHAFDFSEEAKNKALNLAQQNDVQINYIITSFGETKKHFDFNSFDAIVLVYVHLHEDIRQNAHKLLLDFLKPGGKLFLEAFSKEQLSLNSGGPKNLQMLYSVEDLQTDFAELKNLKISREDIILKEGAFHQGLANVIRLVGEKRGKFER
ncbi:MAG: class I SAM-dependent methyltransferase [Bacteroidales bacterium]|nr:class I SAM-dependent methyltransferase [Bacteroidales bacterium]